MKSFSFCTKVAFLILLALYTLSCKQKEVPTEDNHIEFDTIRVASNYHLDNDSTKPSCNLKLTFVHPIAYKNTEILDSLNQIFISGFLDETYSYLKPEEALKKYEQTYISNFKRDLDVFFNAQVAQEESNKYFSYYEIIKNEIKYNKRNILAFQVNQTNYKGGTDSFQFLKNYLIDLKTGKLITEDDIFKSGFENTMTPIFKDYLLKKNKVKNIAELDNLGYFGIDEMVPNGNILADDKGITYVFNKGEYSAYKLDPINITIPYSEIEYLMKEDSPIFKFADK